MSSYVCVILIRILIIILIVFNIRLVLKLIFRLILEILNIKQNIISIFPVLIQYKQLLFIFVYKK